MKDNLEAMVSANIMSKRLTQSLSDDLLSQFFKWSHSEPDEPAEIEAIRRLLGIGISPEDWVQMLADAGDVQLSEMGEGRRAHLTATAIARGLVAMSNDEHPAYSDMTELLAILLSEHLAYARIELIKSILRVKQHPHFSGSLRRG